MAILFSTVDIQFNLSNKKLVKSWIKNCIVSSGYNLGNVNIVFCSDNYILEINTKYLNHNYFTDIITFPYYSSKKIDADLLISIDTVKTNSKKFNQTFNRELHRVIIHGVLHLIGFNDKSSEQKQQMRAEEDKWLKEINF